MAKNNSIEKIHGKYYTPKKLALAMTDWAINKPYLRILDPAFGRGAFLEAALNTIEKKGFKNSKKLYGVEIDDNAKKYLSNFLEFGAQESNFIIEDFLSLRLHSSFGDKFDLIMGNPPFVRHHQISNKLKQVAVAAMQDYEFKISTMSGYWVYFLLHSLSFLKKGGSLAMILPKAFISAEYSKEIRRIISNIFEKASILVLNGRWFHEAEESVVMLLAENYIRNTQKYEGNKKYRNEEELISKVGGFYIPDINKTINDDWNLISEYIPDEIHKFLQSSLSNNLTLRLKDLVTIKIGVVTGANKFFILTKSESEKLRLDNKHLKPIITKSRLLKGLDFLNTDISQARKDNLKTELLITSHEEKNLSKKIIEYINTGKLEGINNRYKCRNRNPWHLVKDIYSPDAFLHYMSSSLPHIILNLTSSTCTNTIHRITWNKQFTDLEKKAITIASTTSLAQIGFEMEGRSLGGGVLKLEPNSALKVIIPKYPISDVHETYEKVNTSLRKGDKELAVKIADEFILEEFLNLKHNFIKSLRTWWKKIMMIRQSSSIKNSL